MPASPLGALGSVPTAVSLACSVAGFPDDLTTYGVVSGLWASSFALGAFVGPSVAGVLFDTVGFRKGTYFIIAVHLLVVSKPSRLAANMAIFHTTLTLIFKLLK